MRARTALRMGALIAPVLACACTALLDLEPLRFDDPADATTVADVLADAASDSTPDAAAPTRCSDGKRHDFCDDFEGITGAVEDRWDKRKELEGSGQFGTLAADAAPSPPTAFRASIDRGPDGGTNVHIARLSKQQSPWARTDGGGQPFVRFAFQAYFEEVDAMYEASIVNVTLGQAPASEDVLQITALGTKQGVTLRLFEVYVSDGGVAYGAKDIQGAVPIGTWVEIVLEIQERAPGLNGGAVVTVGTATQSYAIASSTRAPYFRADLGLSVGTLAGARTAVLYDDVRIDYLP